MFPTVPRHAKHSSPPPGGGTKDAPESALGQGGGDGKKRIRCPKCGWVPRADSLWSCTCDHAWNTFDTGGRCPACSLRWANTCCLRCGEWSRHADWYVKEPEPRG